HSQCPEAWFLRTPGWKIVAPSTPSDAKGLLTAALRDNNPVIYLEAKGLYGFFRTDLREEVPLGDFEVEMGKGVARRAGEGAAILSEKLTWELDAPTLRVAAPDTPVPYSPPLEHAHLPRASDVAAAARALMQR